MNANKRWNRTYRMILISFLLTCGKISVELEIESLKVGKLESLNV